MLAKTIQIQIEWPDEKTDDWKTVVNCSTKIFTILVALKRPSKAEVPSPNSGFCSSSSLTGDVLVLQLLSLMRFSIPISRL